MPEYVVNWMIDIYADTPIEAARQALAVQRDPSSSATVFEVVDESGVRHRVDLEELCEHGYYHETHDCPVCHK